LLRTTRFGSAVTVYHSPDVLAEDSCVVDAFSAIAVVAVNAKAMHKKSGFIMGYSLPILQFAILTTSTRTFANTVLQKIGAFNRGIGRAIEIYKKLITITS
jgi:hypothetical protein